MVGYACAFLFYDFLLVVALGGQLPFYFGGN